MMAKSLYVKNSVYLFTAIFLFSFYIGYSSKIGNSHIEPFNTDKEVKISLVQAIDIVNNNLLLGVSLILGFLTANILNYTIIIYNGLIFGVNFSMYLSYIDLKTNILIFLPHGLLEVAWMIGLSSISVHLFFSFIDYVKSDYTDQTFLQIFKSKKFLLFTSLIIAALLVELLVTPLLVNLAKS